MKKLSVLLIFLTIAIIACGTSQKVTELSQVTATNKWTPSHTPSPSETATLVPTDTNTPTTTFTPTNTFTPTMTFTSTASNTPIPTDTSTPVPTPIPPEVLTGKGNKVLDVSEAWLKGGVMKVTYKGGGNFIVWGYDSNGNQTDLIVNTIGNYQGLVPLNFEGEGTTRLQVKSSGTWEFKIMELNPYNVNRVGSDGKYTGKGDDILLYYGSGKTFSAKCSKMDNFIIWGYTTEGKKDLLVNEICPYEGESIFPTDTFLLVVKTLGEWSIEIK